MKIAFPVKEDNGLKSRMNDHFGVAGEFMIVDLETRQTRVVPNKKAQGGSSCKTGFLDKDAGVDAVVTKCIGDGSQRGLHSSEIQVYAAGADTVAENLALFEKGELKLFHIFDLCQGKKNKKEGGAAITNPVPALLSLLAKLIYRLMGWTYDPLPGYWEDKCVVIGFPHTRNMDTVRALTYIKLARINARLLVKSVWFFFPMSVLLKSLGGMPVKRDKAHGMVGGVVKEFNRRRNLVVALVPEGTRKEVRSIKTGFWHIARGADVPIICWYLDNGAKRTRWLGKIHPSDSLDQDLDRIRAIYERHGFSIPASPSDPEKN